MFVRVTGSTYDPNTGTIANTETTYTNVKIVISNREDIQNGEERYEIDVWMALSRHRRTTSHY